MRNIISKMQPCITVLTHISSDVSQPALYLTAKNGQKYLIGRISEGFQRSIGEQGIRTSKLSGVFLTGGYHWDSVSGLPGMLLSFADRELGIEKLHTGPGIPKERATEMIKSWSNFTFHQPINIQAEDSSYVDENVEINPITIGGDSTSFVLQLQPVRGKFMVEKAKALGVPAGQLFRQLSDGLSVKIPGTNKIVESNQVVGPAPVPARVLVLDLPTMRHVEHSLQDQYIDMFTGPTAATTSTGFDLRAVYYFFGNEVNLESNEVKQLVMRLTGPYTKHYISHPSTSPNFNTLATLASFQSAFRSEFPDHFSLLHSEPALSELPDTLKQYGNSMNNSHYSGSEDSNNLHGHQHQQHQLQYQQQHQHQNGPVGSIDILAQQHILSLIPREEYQEGQKKRTKKAKVEEEWKPSIQVNSESIKGLSSVPCNELDEPEIITLGTGASSPSKYRNVSSTLVRTRLGSLMFDCGEGTYNTMMRIYGPDGALAQLRDLRVLYISHMHADHHLGAQQVLRSWIAQAQKHDLPKLIVATPVQFQAFIRHWSKFDNFEKELNDYVTLIDLESVCIGKRYSSTEPISQKDIDSVTQQTGGIQIMACTAIHCSHSYNGSISLRTDSLNETAFKVSYSGDTRPNRFFARSVGYGSDLLIHEATHENELAEEALKKRHSTIGEAIGIAKLMAARNTILTHISQRYPRLPAIGVQYDADTNDGQYVCFGFDAMHTKLSQIRNIQEMVPKMGELLEALKETEAEQSSDV